jgi:hypothetical protein
MIITNYQVQSTLRAYGQQLAEKSRLARAKAPKNTGPKDEVILSQESKKRLTAQKVQQIIRQFPDGQELVDTHREVLSRLSREYGQPVKVEKKEGQGLVFKVPEGKASGGTRNASPEEAEILNKKLFEITQSVVYNNLG